MGHAIDFLNMLYTAFYFFIYFNKKIKFQVNIIYDSLRNSLKKKATL